MHVYIFPSPVQVASLRHSCENLTLPVDVWEVGALPLPQLDVQTAQETQAAASFIKNKCWGVNQTDSQSRSLIAK